MNVRRFLLNREEIERLIEEENLVEDYPNLETQLTPNGFDLTVAGIFEFDTQGALDFSNKERKISKEKEIFPQKENPQDKFGTSVTLSASGERPSTSRGTHVLESPDLARDGSKDGELVGPFIEGRSRTIGWWNLKKGTYKIKTNETIKLPNDLVAFAFPRTSLLRMGAFTVHGVWDAGFMGKSEFILVVENPHGIKIKQNARIAQIVFVRIKETGRGYQGVYQENN